MKIIIKNSIRRLRFEQNEMTQQELANKVDCTRQTIIALEQGKYSPSLELAFKIAPAFKSRFTLSCKIIVPVKYNPGGTVTIPPPFSEQVSIALLIASVFRFSGPVLAPKLVIT